MYEKEKNFFDMAAARTEQDIEEWLKTIHCHVIRIDGTKPIEENVRSITEELFKQRIILLEKVKCYI